eukprot:g8479.t1
MSTTSSNEDEEPPPPPPQSTTSTHTQSEETPPVPLENEAVSTVEQTQLQVQESDSAESEPDGFSDDCTFPPPPEITTENAPQRQSKVFTRIITFIKPKGRSLSSGFSLKRRTTSTDVVTLKQFTDAASCQTDVLPRRIYKVLRQEGGEVTKDTLLEATTGRLEEQIQFAYDVYDMNDDGVLSKDDFKISLKACLDENHVNVETTLIDDAIASVYEKLDPKETGIIEYEVFKDCFEEYSESISQSKVVRRRGDWRPMLSQLSTMERTQKKFKQLASYIAKLKNSWLGRVLPLDDAISFHKFIGRIGFAAATVHTFSHVVDVLNWSDKGRYELFRKAFPDELNQPTLFELVTSIVGVTGVLLYLIMCIAYLFALDYPRKWKAIEHTRVGKVLNNFNNFWYTHHLFALFYVLLIIHPVPGLPDERNEWGVSDFWLWGGLPIFIYLLERILRVYRQGSWQTKILDSEGISSDTVIIWLTKPKRFNAKAGMYIFLNCPDIAKFEWHPYTLTSAPQDDHLRVHIASLGDWSSAMKKKFEVSIHSPLNREKSRFPLLNMTEDQSSPVGQITPVDDPTSFFKYSSKLATTTELTIPEDSPKIFVDGPYGAPCQEFDQFSTVMLIGAGIGITPFASILRDLLARFDDHRCCHCGRVSMKKSFRVKKVYFIWVARDPKCALWFNKDLHALKADDQDSILDIQIFITGVQPPVDVRSKLLFMTQRVYFEKSGVDLLTGSYTNALTNFGRPDWTKIFQEATQSHPNTTIGVFFCGQYVLGQILEKNCRKFSGRNGTKFDYMYERF